ncbi:MAG: hypothetical protein IJ087_09710 [Eggerthellaceae bacterium]|nr:hypothetical protein [Eggerthellaceae bacterium]
MSQLTDFLASAGVSYMVGRASGSAVSKAPVFVLGVVVVLEVVFVALALSTGAPTTEGNIDPLSKIPAILIGLVLSIVTGLAVLGTGHGVIGIVGGLALAFGTLGSALTSSMLSGEVIFFILMVIPLVKRVLESSGISLRR